MVPGPGGYEALSGTWLVLSPRVESFWRAEPAQTREGRGRKEPAACESCGTLPPEGPRVLTSCPGEKRLVFKWGPEKPSL